MVSLFVLCSCGQAAHTQTLANSKVNGLGTTYVTDDGVPLRGERPMENYGTQRPAKLEAVHVCEKCENRFCPDQLNENVNVTGVVECKICSHIGPLRILVLPQERDLRDKP
jgi:DNA-directed RNA polymerase subunit RPC12/RpoP